jgi:hypothetical protein
VVNVRIRDRNQLTIPVDIANAAGLGPGSLCHMELVNGVITLRPADAPPSRELEHFVGLARGAWGETEEEIDARIADDRDSWRR